jgi:alpha-glucosidase
LGAFKTWKEGGDEDGTMSGEWWRGGVVYQIYPRSFCDSDNDGVGDLRGVASKLDYLSSLGVDGVWLSPFFRSPMRDFGYDVSDYRDVDPIFGTLADFDAVLKGAHKAGLKLIIDQVYSHTSDQHLWFKESRSSKDNPKADWYVWAEAKPDGGPPNNWISLFGGQAWSWDTRRRQYYMHNFLAEQPDLNFHNGDVRAEILDTAKFWLERGVDGFRLDVANFYFCDEQLRDNPPKRPEGGYARPYWHQRHLYDRSQPENLVFMEDLRRLTDRYDGRMTVAEIGSDSYIARSIEYTEPGRLHTAYNFLLLENGPLTAKFIRDTLESWTSETAWPSWSFSNHDVVRSRTRWGGEDAGDDFARMLMGLLMCLKGTIFLYQGEELGLPQADVPFEKLKDPEGIRFWPDSLGRDGCRTPMPWRAGAANAGFSDVEPWLPVDPRHDALAVDKQEVDPASTLNATRAFIAFRRDHRALRDGAIEFLDAGEPILAFRRRNQDQSLLCVFNFGAAAQTFALPKGAHALDYGLPGKVEGGRAVLPAFGGVVVEER